MNKQSVLFAVAGIAILVSLLSFVTLAKASDDCLAAAVNASASYQRCVAAQQAVGLDTSMCTYYSPICVPAYARNKEQRKRDRRHGEGEH